MDAHAKGVLSKILVQSGEVVPVDQPIAYYVDDMREYMELVEQVRVVCGGTRWHPFQIHARHWGWRKHRRG